MKLATLPSIAIKGDVKDTKTYQVQMVNGQQQKALVNDQKAGSGGGRQGPVKEHVIEKKTEEYQEYGQSIGALAKPDICAHKLCCKSVMPEVEAFYALLVRFQV